MSNGGGQFWAKQFVNDSGTPYSGVKVYHYASGSSTDKTVWADEGKTTEASQPVTGDSRGYVWFYADGDYRLKVTDSTGIVLYDWDNARITQDTATMWEGNYGLSYPAATIANRWQMFLKHTAGNKFSELGVNDGTAFIPVVSVDSNLKYALDTGTADAYVIAPNPPITAYAIGQEFTFKAVNANTGASTLAVNGLTAKAIKKNQGTALEVNNILANQMITVVYDGTNFELLNPIPESGTQTLSNKTFSDTITSILATGTQPLTVISTTECVNLNSERHGGLRVKVVDIGDWNMDTTSTANIAHGLTLTNIRGVEVTIRSDSGNLYPFGGSGGAVSNLSITSADADLSYTQNEVDLLNELKSDINNLITNYFDPQITNGIFSVDSTNVGLVRAAGGLFDGVGFDATSYNRGWIIIWYVP